MTLSSVAEALRGGRRKRLVVGDDLKILSQQPQRPKYVSNALWQGTVQENTATADGTITYFGTYSVSEVDSSISIHQLTSTVRTPNGDVVDVVWKRAN